MLRLQWKEGAEGHYSASAGKSHCFVHLDRRRRGYCASAFGFDVREGPVAVVFPTKERAMEAAENALEERLISDLAALRGEREGTGRG